MGFLDQMKQLGAMKAKMDEIKRKLDEAEVVEENQHFKVIVGGNRRIKNVELKNEVVDTVLLKNTINEALEKTDAFVQKEMMGAMPEIPGM
jgi:DNA-binding protein YbaB